MSRITFAMEFAGSTVEWAQSGLELAIEEIAQTVGADRKTVGRWRAKQSAPTAEHRRHLERLNQLRHLLETSFRSKDAQQRWLHTPLAALDGRTPLFALLGTLAAGAHR